MTAGETPLWLDENENDASASPLRIGVVSDTHIRAADSRRVVPFAVLEAFRDVSCILHAGDISCRAVLDDLGRLAPVYAVHGNVDNADLTYHLPTARLLHFGSISVGLTHGHIGEARTTSLRARRRFSGAPGLRAVVFGHSHEPYNCLHEDVLLFNPGSPTERRRQPWPSFGLLTIAGADVSGEVVYLQ